MHSSRHSQNIVYAVWKEDKTVNEIADCLGVSPVYVESEAEYLAEYGFLTENKGKYRYILIDEASNELVKLHDEMYRESAKLFANELFDELTNSGILKDERIICGQSDQSILLTESPRADDNFILWSLVPYIAALSGEKFMDKSISFEVAQLCVRTEGIIFVMLLLSALTLKSQCILTVCCAGAVPAGMLTNISPCGRLPPSGHPMK